MKFRLICTITLFVTYTNLMAIEPLDLLQHTATQEQLKTFLNDKKQWIPYPDYSDRKGWDEFSGDLKTKLIKEGEGFLNYNWRIITATQYLEYERSGSRTAMEEPANANNRAISRLLLAELVEGKGRFIDQLINGIWAACDMPSWVASAHLYVQKSKRSLPEFNEQIIDLASGDMGAFYSWTWYFLHTEFDKVNPVIASRLLKCIQERILIPYTERNDYWWQALDGKVGALVNNWNPWCNFNVLTCFLLLENDADKRAAAVYKTMRSTDQFINYIKTDGACEEGPSYWGHAAGKLYDYLELLNRATSGKINLFGTPMFRSMGEYIVRSYVGNDWVVNFADASAKGGGEPGLIFRYGKAVNSQEMKAFAAYLFNNNKGSLEVNMNRDLFRTLENISSYKEIRSILPALPDARITWYPQTEFCYIKNKEGFFLAAKAGFNNESHNHNDVGTFSLYANEIPFFIDAGVGTYTRQTFGPERYSIWTMQSEFHNLPVINGKAQVFGAEYKARNTKFDTARNSFSTDIAGAYPASANVESWIRSYQLKGSQLTINDAFTLHSADSCNEIHFLTWAEPKSERPGLIRFTKDSTTLLFSYDPKQFNFNFDIISQTDKRLSSVWGDKIYRIRLSALYKKLKGRYSFQINKEN